MGHPVCPAAVASSLLISVTPGGCIVSVIPGVQSSPISVYPIQGQQSQQKHFHIFDEVHMLLTVSAKKLPPVTRLQAKTTARMRADVRPKILG